MNGTNSKDHWVYFRNLTPENRSNVTWNLRGKGSEAVWIRGWPRKRRQGLRSTRHMWQVEKGMGLREEMATEGKIAGLALDSHRLKCKSGLQPQASRKLSKLHSPPLERRRPHKPRRFFSNDLRWGQQHNASCTVVAQEPLSSLPILTLGHQGGNHWESWAGI